MGISYSVGSVGSCKLISADAQMSWVFEVFGRIEPVFCVIVCLLDRTSLLLVKSTRSTVVSVEALLAIMGM